MLDKHKPIRTRDGVSVRIISFAGPAPQPIIGFIADSTVVQQWREDGAYYVHNAVSKNDLVNVDVPIDWSKPLQTRQGSKVRLLASDGAKIGFPRICEITEGVEKSYVGHWSDTGAFTTTEHPLDLSNVPEPVRPQDTFLVNVYKDGGIFSVGSPATSVEQAERYAGSGRVYARIRVNLTEGQRDE